MDFFSFGQYSEWDEERAICLYSVNSVIVPIWNSLPKRRLKLNYFLTCAHHISCLTSICKLLNEELPQRSTFYLQLWKVLPFFREITLEPILIKKAMHCKINLILQAKMTITLINNLLFNQRKMNFSQLINCFRTWALSKFISIVYFSWF